MLTWDEVKDKFENLVKFAAKNTYLSRNHVDNAVSVEDLYQIGMTKLYDCWVRYNNLSIDEFKQVFTTTLFRAVRRGAKPVITLDLETAITEAENHTEETLETMYFREGFKQLQEMLTSPIAVAILQELIEPSPRTLWEVWADKARKEMLKAQGKSVNMPQSHEVRMKHIRNALGITQKQFDIGIAEIRQKAKLVFQIA